jgi:hypothetical protein
MYISCKERGLRGAERTIRKHASILGEGNVFRLLCWGECSMFQKYWC